MARKKLQHPENYGLGRPVVDVSRFDTTYMMHPATGELLPVYRRLGKKGYEELLLGSPDEKV